MEISVEVDINKVDESAKFNKLRTYNIIMGLLHLVSGIAIVWLSNSFKTPVTTTYLQFDPFTQTLNTTVKHLFDVHFGYWVAVFSFLSAAFHFSIATFYFPTYVENLKKHINKARWIEYALSASLMIVLIGLLSGIYDLSTLVMMYGLTAVMNLCGLIMEEHNLDSKKPNWLSFWVGTLAGLLPWVAIVIYFAGAASATNNAIPSFVYWIYVSIFILFNTFAVNMYLQYKKVGPWKDYLYGEKVYILLSLVAKLLLAWQIFFGTLRPM